MLLSSFVFVLVYVAMCPSSFAIILTRKRELVALLLLSFGCLVTVNVLLVFLTVLWVGLQFLIVVFLDHTHFIMGKSFLYKKTYKTMRPTAYIFSKVLSNL